MISATGMSISESGKLDDGLLETNTVPGENEDGVSPYAEIWRVGYFEDGRPDKREGRFPGRDPRFYWPFSPKMVPACFPPA